MGTSYLIKLLLCVHVGIMSVLLCGVLRSVGVSRRGWIWALGPALVLYTFATGGKASAVRACVMALFFWAAPTFSRRSDALSSLAAAAMVILLSAPGQLMEPGFIMSFTVVSGLILLYPFVFEGLSARLLNRSWSAEPVLRENRFWLSLKKGGIGWVSLALSAWMVSTPLTAWYINLVSPVALFANLLVVPFAFLIVLTGCLSVVSGLFFLQVAAVFNFANQLFVNLLMAFVNGLKEVPGAYRFVVIPGVWLVLVSYGGLLMFTQLRGRLRRRLLIVLCVCVVAGLFLTRETHPMRMTMLDVGQGSCTYLELPGRRGGNVLVDCGPERAVEGILRQLHHRGVNVLDTLILTHFGPSFSGGAVRLLEQIPVRNIWCVDPAHISAAFPEQAAAVSNLLEQATASGAQVYFPSGGDGGHLDAAGEVAWQVFWPPEHVRSVSYAREASLVLRIASGGCAVLFCGAAANGVESQLIDAGMIPAASVLMVGGHGARGACSRFWLQKVQPKLVLISCGRHNEFGDPHPELLQRLQGADVPYWRTDQAGALCLEWVKKAPYFQQCILP